MGRSRRRVAWGKLISWRERKWAERQQFTATSFILFVGHCDRTAHMGGHALGC